MGRYFLDLEFTNGNYYLADIIELALLAEHSGNIFHSYVRIHYLIPTRVKELTNISDDLLATAGCSFKDTIASLSAFLCDEQKRSDTQPIIIAHAGFSFGFPILFANFIKHIITHLNAFRIFCSLTVYRFLKIMVINNVWDWIHCASNLV